MTILVTGGSGHLGANLIRRLVAEGERVVALERPGSDNRALDGLPIERISGDLRNADDMTRAMRGVRRVYHCAARVSTTAGGEREIYDCNVVGTKNCERAEVTRSPMAAALARRTARVSHGAISADATRHTAASAARTAKWTTAPRAILRLWRTRGSCSGRRTQTCCS